MNPPITRTPPLAYHQVIMLALILFSMGMSAFISQQTFERLPHLEDEVAYLWEAKLLARGQAVMDVPTPRRAFWQPFVVDLGNNRFGKYTLGWPLMLTPGVLIGQPWLVNALLSGISVFLVYRLGMEIFDPDVAVIAAALTAFSPMALLLNGTLMGHTAALFTTLLFMFAYWRMEQGQHRLRWAVIAGISLGFCVINRPLEGLALSASFIAWSGLRLVQAVIQRKSAPETLPETPVLPEGDATPTIPPASDISSTIWLRLRQSFVPLITLAIVTGVILLAIPVYNYAASGDATKNLYTLVWSYDQVGFGEGYGRHGHTLEKGLRQTRWDLSLTAADIFGWEIDPVTDQNGTVSWQLGGLLGADGKVKPDLEKHLLLDGDYWSPVGLSWILLPFGLFLGFRRKWWLFAIWLIVGGVIFMQTTTLPPAQLQDPKFSILWMIGAALYLCIPCFFFLRDKVRDTQVEWTYLFLAFALFLIGLHIAYWIGSQRYSTRYYYEMLAPLAIISALPLAWIARRFNRWVVYAGVLAVLVVTLFTYSLPRINALYRFNWVSPQLIDAVNAHRDPNDPRPVLVLIKGSNILWRALGSLMAETSPLLDGDIVAAIDNTTPGFRQQILDKFPDRQVIEMTADGNYSCFGDKLEGECYGDPPAPTG
ncbi:MAG: glycosyltransferase family 39 protein [Chloroflexota bacterium]